MIIDISQWQGKPDWPRLKAAGVTCAIIRCSLGLRADSEFARNWAESARVGIERRGVYHYYTTEISPLAQAAALLAVTGGDCGNEPVTVDCERRADERLLPFDKAAYTANVKLFLDELAEALPQVRQRIYTSAEEWHQITTQPEWARDGKYAKWLAHYNAFINAPATPPGWRWDRWQFTSVGRVDGISGNVDLNRDAVELPHLDPAPVETEANVQYLLTVRDVTSTARVLELLGTDAVELQAVVPIQIPSIPPPPIPDPPLYTVRVKVAVLNVRGGVGTAYPIVNTLPLGTLVNVYAEQGLGTATWGRIAPEVQQWINVGALYVERVPPAI
jgi:GH25 family lysozyme M1 (1,4-beta-N-acetylmuramidase)